jgi:hypothetical protein
LGANWETDSELAGRCPWKSADRPSTPSAKKMSALTIAPRFGTHLETSRRTIPTPTVNQVRTIAIEASCQGDFVFRNIWPKVPAKIVVNRRDPGRVVDPVQPGGGRGCPHRTEASRTHN